MAELMPKFQNLEEEVKYLREQLAGKESLPIEKKEKLVKKVVTEYAKAPAEKVLVPEKVLPEKEAEGIVLKLKPEAHDNQMAELLGILLNQGIKNALTVLEKLNSPHLED